MNQSTEIAEAMHWTRRARRVIIVEDSDSDAILAIALLEEVGCLVTRCKTGEEAVALARRHFDMIVIDLELPGINGVETARRIRMMDSNVTIVVNSSTYEGSQIAEALKQGYIVCPKPFSINKIRALAFGVGIFKSL